MAQREPPGGDAEAAGAAGASAARGAGAAAAAAADPVAAGRPHRTGRRGRGGCGLWTAAGHAWRRVTSVLAACVCRLPRLRTWNVQLPPVRVALCEELRRAEREEPRLSEDEVELAGGRAAARAVASARATRAPATVANARTALRQLLAFVEANPRLLRARVPLTGDIYDIAVEAWLLTRCGGDSSPWCATGAGTGGPRAGGTARAMLDRLGYSRGSAWTRATVMARALGATDAHDVVHHLPVFVWELAEGLAQRPPCTLWESAAAALVVLGALAARRKSGAGLLLLEQVQQTGPTSVSIAPRHRPKPHRQRVQARRELCPRVVVVKHWLVAKYVIPWLQWHARRPGPANGYLFPSIVDMSRVRVRTSVGRAVGSQWWVEPLRRWSQDATTAAVRRCLLSPEGRTFQGLRVGNNIELTRLRSVSTATRRTLHERSLKPLIGSEEAYIESFAEDFEAATQELGKLRIARRPDGLLSVAATSASAGEVPSDWVATPAAEWFAAQPVAEEGEDADGSDGSSSAFSSVVGDGDESTRETVCGRCGRKLGRRDYGFLCDHPTCKWACCVDCHPGGASADLWCPPHALARRGT